MRIKLTVTPPDLADLPWEFLYDAARRDYLCLDATTPLVRYPALPLAIQPLPMTPPLRILGLCVGATDQPRLDVSEEKARLDAAVQPLQAQGLVELTWLTGQTADDLQRALRRGPWHILHFIGHGRFDATRDEGLLLLTDATGRAAPLYATQLARLLASQRHHLRLVLLNACEGARGGRLDRFASTAATLVGSGIPAVLAMQYAITDDAAIDFARTFYEALADNLPVDSAVADARNAMTLRNPYSLEWGTPVLYLRAPDGRLFAPKPNDEQKTSRTVLQIPIEFDWVHIPAGEFLMGRDVQHSPSGEYSPQHTVYLPDYSIARVPVTNAQYKLFLDATKNRPPSHWVDGCIPNGKENHPVANVSWHHAQAFCRWAGVRLPTEAEWEKAARGSDGRKYPWGDEPLNERLCNFYGSQIKDTTPVGSYPAGASPYGVLDMIGNIWEWTDSRWGSSVERPKYSYPYDKIDGREDSNGGGRFVIRGGSFHPDEGKPHCAIRGYPEPEEQKEVIGFRVACDETSRKN